MIDKAADIATIVMNGSFNPSIFHPVWFEKNGLIPSTETENAQIDTISNDIAIFTMSWVRIEVIAERFIAKTTDESKFGPLRDLVLGTFRLLEFTPCYQLGLNRTIHFKFPNEDSWHAVGHALAPKKHWEKYLNHPGMKTLTIEAKRPDDYDGTINITVRPVLTHPLPVREWIAEVSVNDHYDLGENETVVKACSIIDSQWSNSFTKAIDIANGIIQDTATHR